MFVMTVVPERRGVTVGKRHMLTTVIQYKLQHKLFIIIVMAPNQLQYLQEQMGMQAVMDHHRPVRHPETVRFLQQLLWTLLPRLQR